MNSCCISNITGKLGQSYTSGNFNVVAHHIKLPIGSNMIEANENFVNWIIKKVGINESSRLLEIGCGRGAYAINISKKTGQYVITLTPFN